MRSGRRKRRSASVAVLTLYGALSTACYPGSDAEVAARQSRREQQQRLADMRAATRTTPAGAPLAADQLAAAVVGATHVFVYTMRPDRRPGRYVEWYYFAPGGQFVYLNTMWAGERSGHAENRWRLDGDRLCFVNAAMTPEERCFRLARRADGRLQYSFAMPGDAHDGLLTRVTDAELAGPPPADAGPAPPPR
jgi:drug/metabolite transporter superfamily protein YnfA